MKNYTEEEKNLIHSLHKPIDNIDETLISQIIDKMLNNKSFEELIYFLNNLYNFAKVPKNIVAKLINENNKECISVFLENEDNLYFLINKEKKILKDFLNVYEINIKLEETYDYYYNLLFKQGVRHCKSTKINCGTIEHSFMRYNKLIRIKIKEIKEIGLVVSYINYCNYNLPENEQILNGIDYINEYGFNIERNINNDAIIKKIVNIVEWIIFMIVLSIWNSCA